MAALAAVLALPAAGQEEIAPPVTLPALFSVAGVAPGDVLNIRAEPDAAAEKIGELAPDAVGVEVTARTAPDGWGRVNTGERAGWVSLGFLAPQDGGALPEVSRLSCFGTEPFWSLDADAGGLSNLSDPEGEALFLTGPVQPGAGRSDVFGVTGGAAGRTLALAIRAAECSDGMSDRLYGLSATVLVGGTMPRTLAGCCSLDTAER
ncbi:COG3650 family protein [Roseivivax isoporae]|uniref:COG3650 family protein n=1 Tax=Roseivivax isoporae TaxID=591206 RepID=UPI0004AF93C4|nr:SH3 domain-containing protein [Roseivivax isoporae]